MATTADMYKQYYSSRSGYTYPTTSSSGAPLLSLDNTRELIPGTGLTERTLVSGGLWGGFRLPEYRIGVSVLPQATLPLPSAPKTGGTGVSRSPLSGFRFRMPEQEQTQPTPQGISWESIMQGVGQPYRDLIGQLNTLVEQERGNINSGASSLASYLQGMDPMAGYRETAPALQAPTAAASGYLGAIGADPMQIQALQNLQNQMMASQAAGQSAFGQAVDTSQANYRAAQLAEAAMNQQRAQAALSSQLGGQTAAINMARIQQENAVRQALLELQLQLIQMAAQNKGEIDLGGDRGQNQPELTLGMLLGQIGAMPTGGVV